MPAVRQRSLHPLPRRLRDWWAAWRPGSAGRLARSHRVYAVEIGGHRVKRVVLADAHLASHIAANLEEFAGDDVFPAVLLLRERELWVEFIEGERVTGVDADVVRQVARLLSVLHRRRPRLAPIDETPYARALARDLQLLERVGVLGAAVRADVLRRAESLAPPALWIGYDCTDAIQKNFVRGLDGRIRGVDVESLGSEQLLGTGPAKACLRWLGTLRDPFLEEIQGAGGPDFQSYFEFVELCFLAFWQKVCCLEGKHHFVEPALFDRFRSRG